MEINDTPEGCNALITLLLSRFREGDETIGFSGLLRPDCLMTILDMSGSKPTFDQTLVNSLILCVILGQPNFDSLPTFSTNLSKIVKKCIRDVSNSSTWILSTKLHKLGESRDEQYNSFLISLGKMLKEWGDSREMLLDAST
jgi:hypothetical protein